MSLTMAMVSLAVTLGGNFAPGTLSWERDYRQAKLLGEKLQRPLAVFVSTGVDGWQQLAREKKFDESVERTLRDNYVRVYVDATTSAGRKLADAFGFGLKPGLVISDRTGGVQAFWYEGDLALTDLTRVLTRYSDRQLVVQTTETHYSHAGISGYVQPVSYDPYYQPACRT